METGVSLQTIKVRRRKTTALIVGFSGPLDAASAQDVAAYRLVTAGRDKKFGTRDDKVIRLASATYNASSHAVTLTPRAALPKGQMLQLRAFGSALRDSSGRPIDGDRDNQPGGDLVTTLGKGRPANRQRIANLFPTAHRLVLCRLGPTAHRSSSEAGRIRPPGS